MADQPPAEPPPETTRHHPRARLAVICFGLATGITAAIFTFVLGISAGLFGWGAVPVEILSNLFIGYGPHFVGGIAGAVWAFVDAFVAGMLIAWFYNKLLRSPS